MAAAASSPLECPVCHEEFTVPKLLPCAHLVCHKCVVSWLQKGGDQAGCPLCRAPIFPASHSSQGDLDSQVDALPTDFATAVMVESEKTLSGSQVCSCCEDAEGTLFCLQCAIKLCSTCAKFHAKIPATRDHVIEKLSDLSAEQVVSHHQINCTNHSGKQVELYCASHEELICVLCFSSVHRKCPEVKGVADVASEKKEELRALVKKLDDRKAVIMAKISMLDNEVSDGQAKFKAMRDEVRTTFDALQMSLEAERQKLNLEIQQREDAFVTERKTSKLDLETYEASLSAHRSTSEHLLASAPVCSLLSMTGKLKSRLAALESQALPGDPKTTTGSLALNSDTAKKTKEGLAAIVKLIESSTSRKLESSTPRKAQDIESELQNFWSSKACLEGPAYAAVIKVGDRVRRGWDWKWGSQDGLIPGQGTVMKVPGNLESEWVQVKWDRGQEFSYRMGVDGWYDLKCVGVDRPTMGPTSPHISGSHPMATQARPAVTHMAGMLAAPPDTNLSHQFPS